MAKRGRPTIDDDPLLKKVAARLAKHPEQSPRSAIVQALPEYSDSAVRRLQRKWLKNGEAYLKAAQEDLQEQKTDRVVRRNLLGGVPAANLGAIKLDQIVQAQQRVQAMLDSGAMSKALRQIETLQRAIDRIDPLRHIRSVLEQQERMQRLLNR